MQMACSRRGRSRKARDDGPPRSMTIEMAPDEGGNVVAYTLVEGVGHSFTVGE